MVASAGLTQSVFTQDGLFSSLTAAQFEAAAAQTLALRLFSDPAEFTGLLDQPITVAGASADLPALFSQPNLLSLGNLVLLAQGVSGINLSAFFETSNFDQLADALISRPPPLANPAADAITNAFPEPVDEEEVVSSDALSIGTITGPLIQFSDFLQRPSENTAFGSTFSGLTQESGLNSVFFTRVGAPSGGSVAIQDLLLNTQSSTATDFAVSLTGENGANAIGSLLLSGAPIANNTVITRADLANLTYSGPTTGIGLDNLNLIELRDDENDDVFEARGSFQTITFSSAGEDQSRRDGDERIRDFFFGAEASSAQTQLTLRFSGLNSQGFTDVLSAINAGELRVRAVENRADGSFNQGITNLFQSSANEIIIRFPFQPTQNGVSNANIQVELRSLNLDLDISTVNLFAIFG